MKEAKLKQKFHIILPLNHAGFGTKLKNALITSGFNARLLEFRRHKFQYESDIVLKSENLLIFELQKFYWFFIIIFKFHYIHFTGGQTLWAGVSIPAKKTFTISYVKALLHYFYSLILQNLELRMYTIFRKKIFFYFLGSHARLNGWTLKNFEYNIAFELGFVDCFTEDQAKRKIINKLSKYSAKSFAVNPDLLHNLPENSIYLPIPFDDTPVFRNREKYNKDKFLIGHAPSDRKTKGTKYIEQACSNLLDRGYSVELRIFESLDNQNLKNELLKIDLFIDQIIAGWYGVAALESISVGCPTIVYIRNKDLKFIPDRMREELPFISANKDNLEFILEKILESKNIDDVFDRKKGIRFLSNWHNPISVVDRISPFF